MPQTYKVDQAATFAGVVLLSVEPKVAFGGSEQEKTSEGVAKWEVQLVAGFRQFGRVVNEVLKVGVAAHRNPGEGVVPYTPVELVGLEIGVMEKRSKTGGSWGRRCGTGRRRCARQRPWARGETRWMGREWGDGEEESGAGGSGCSGRGVRGAWHPDGAGVRVLPGSG